MRNNLKHWRKKRELSQQQLAVKANCSIGYIQILEQQSERTAGVDIGERLARALDIDPDQLFFRPDFGADRIATLGELYADDLIDLHEEDRAMVIRYVLCMDQAALKVLSRGRTRWAVLWDNARAFDEYMKKFPPKR